MHAEVALEAIAPAAVGAAHRDQVAGLGIEAEAWKNLRAKTSGELQPRRLLEQKHRVSAEHRGRVGAPVTPDIGEHVRLPYASGGVIDGPFAAQAEPPAGAGGGAEPDRTQAVIGVIEGNPLPAN